MSRHTTLRRYPALGFLAVAAVLATLLPSALNVPLSGPSSLAELAPVPPDGESADQAGDLSDLGQADSGGLGVGTGSGGGAGAGVGEPPPEPEPSLAQRRPRTKRCVGRPLRQTEDPLSPPCVAFFDGDNGGATTRGMTRDEVTVVLYVGTRSANTGGVGFVDYADPDAVGNSFDPVARAYMSYFNDRYQTYGRRVRFVGFFGRTSSNGGTSSDVENMRADVLQIDREKRPFAIIPLAAPSVTTVTLEATRRGIFVANHRGLLRRDYAAVAPLLISFQPDIEDSARSGAAYLCRKLADRPARHSGNPADRARERSFGILYTDSPDDPAEASLAAELERAIRDRCHPPLHLAKVSGSANSTYSQYHLALARMRDDGVTTVIPITKGGDPLIYLPAASQIGWFPEWFFARQGSGATQGPDDTTSARVFPPEQWRHAFGVSYDYRRGRVSEQHWFRALREACPSCAVQSNFQIGRAYEVLSLLFYGIQAAGPRLTAASLDKGLHAVRPRVSTSPFVPATYFAPGNYSWVKDAKEMWWDPAGTPPGDSQPGCYRLANGGARFREHEWRPGDADVFAADQPCQGLAQGTG